MGNPSFGEEYEASIQELESFHKAKLEEFRIKPDDVKEIDDEVRDLMSHREDVEKVGPKAVQQLKKILDAHLSVPRELQNQAAVRQALMRLLEEIKAFRRIVK